MFQIYFKNAIKVSNGLDSDQDPHSVIITDIKKSILLACLKLHLFQGTNSMKPFEHVLLTYSNYR